MGVMLDSNWRTAMRLQDFMTGDVSVVTGQYNKLGEYVVKAGERLALGWGDFHGQQDADGRIYADFKDNSASPGASIEGQVQLAIYDPNDHPLVILDEFRTEQLRTNSSDRTKQMPFPIQTVGATRDKKVVLYFKPDVAGTVGLANSSLLMDITKGSSDK